MALNEAPTASPAAETAAGGKAVVTDAARRSNPEPKKVHITDTPITLANWHKHVSWLNVTLIIAIPIYGLVQAYWVPLHLKTAL
ncbi:delta-9 fatty acid desaturase, partial [Histoplasma capsulatum H143]